MNWNMFSEAITWALTILAGVAAFFSILDALACAEVYGKAPRRYSVIIPVAECVAVVGIAVIAGMGWYA